MTRPPALIVSELPANWALFVDCLIARQAPEDAAKACGYDEPKRAGTLLMRHPTVRKALVAATQARLEGEAAPLALQVIMQVLGDPAAPGAVKAKLALGVLDRIQPPKDERPTGDKPLGDLTLAELADEAARLRGSSPRPPEMRDVTPDKTTLP